MNLLIVRHAIAEDRIIFAAKGQDDDLRPLTREGTKKMQQAAQGLKKILPELDLLVSSPLTRAVQTADILHEVYHSAQREQLVLLSPGLSAEELTAWLQRQAARKTIALVGHEPDLGELATWLLAGTRAEPFVAFKKGGVLLIEFPYKIGAGQGDLRWALTPKQLRTLT